MGTGTVLNHKPLFRLGKSGYSTGTYVYLPTSVVDPHSFYANPDPGFFFNADPDLDPDPDPDLDPG